MNTKVMIDIKTLKTAITAIEKIQTFCAENSVYRYGDEEYESCEVIKKELKDIVKLNKEKS